MEFVQKFTPLDFQVKNFTPSILPNFNSFSKKKTQKMSENGEIYTTGKNFTLPPAVTAWTNSTSDQSHAFVRGCVQWFFAREITNRNTKINIGRNDNNDDKTESIPS